MSKYVCIIVLMFLTAFNAYSQRNLLPQISNIYPDTFAIYWEFPNPPVKLKPDETYITIINVMLGGDVTRVTIGSFDTLIVTPFYSDWFGEKALYVKGRYGRIDNEALYREGGYTGKRPEDFTSCRLDVMQTTPKIEALLELKQTTANTTNLLILADAYEEEDCYANAMYIYKRILLLNTDEGRREWAAFCKRNSDKFRWKMEQGVDR